MTPRSSVLPLSECNRRAFTARWTDSTRHREGFATPRYRVF